MHSVLTAAVPNDAIELGFPWWLQVTHFINFLFIGLLVRSGWEILASHPRLYWRNDCGPGTEWLKFTKDKVPSEVGAFTARDDQRSLHPLISLPGRASPGIGRAWHGLITTLWILNGLVHLVLLFGTGQWRRIVPTSWDVFGEAWESLKIYAGFNVPSLEHFQPYDALQQLAYSAVVFLLAPLMILTGAAMSPAIAGRFPWYPKLFGSRQAARSIHFRSGACLRRSSRAQPGAHDDGRGGVQPRPGGAGRHPRHHRHRRRGRSLDRGVVPVTGEQAGCAALAVQAPGPREEAVPQPAFLPSAGGLHREGHLALPLGQHPPAGPGAVA